MPMDSSLADYGVAIVLIFSAVAIIWIVAGVTRYGLTLWRDAARERNAIDTRRNELDEQREGVIQAHLEAQKEIVKHLAALKKRDDENAQFLSGFRRDMELAHGGQLELLGRLQQTIESVPGMTADEVENRVKPLFQGVQKSLESAAASLLSANTQLEQLATVVAAIKAKSSTGEHPLITASETSPDTTAEKKEA